MTPNDPNHRVAASDSDSEFRRGPQLRCILLCTPGMGMNLWGVSPLYVNTVYVNDLFHTHKY